MVSDITTGVNSFMGEVNGEWGAVNRVLEEVNGEWVR
jgi:phage-related tail protein